MALRNLAILVRCWLAYHCLQLFVWLTPKPTEPVIPVCKPSFKVPSYQPTPFELEAAKIVEHYDIPIVMTQDQHAFAVYGQKAGPC